MGRHIEYIKVTEAKILIFLQNTDKHMRCGKRISLKLGTDYIYVMNLLNLMWDKGWVTNHMHHGTMYFEIAEAAPMQCARERLMEKQMRLDSHVD